MDPQKAQYVTHRHDVAATAPPQTGMVQSPSEEAQYVTHRHDVAATAQPQTGMGQSPSRRVQYGRPPVTVYSAEQIRQNRLGVLGILGALQICNGCVAIILNIAGLILGVILMDRAHGFWCGAFYILAGVCGLRVACSKVNIKCWMTSFMVLSIFSIILSIAPLVFGALALHMNSTISRYYRETKNDVVSALFVALAIWEAVIASLSVPASCCCTTVLNDQVTNVPQPPVASSVRSQPGVEQYSQPGTQQPVVYVVNPQPGAGLQSSVQGVQYDQPGTQQPVAYGISPQSGVGKTKPPRQDQNVMGAEAGEYSAQAQHASPQPMEQPVSDHEMAPPSPVLGTPPPTYADYLRYPATSAGARETQPN